MAATWARATRGASVGIPAELNGHSGRKPNTVTRGLGVHLPRLEDLVEDVAVTMMVALLLQWP